MNKVTGNTMTIAHFVDFYMLEALRAGIGMAKSANPELSFKHSFVRLENDVNQAFEHLSRAMALRIWIYLWGAALGEAKYAKEECSDAYFIPEIEGMSYRGTFDIFPTQANIDIVKEVFGQDGWSSAYGGEAWYEIVEGMELYGKISDAAFVDHCVDLEHNGGCVFNKTGEDPFRLNCLDHTMSGYELHYFLDDKFYGDILQGHKTYTTSFKVAQLVVRYSNIVEPVHVELVAGLEWLSDCSIEWGVDAHEAVLTLSEPDRTRCEHCGDCAETTHWVDDEELCDDCAEYCEKCGEYVAKDDAQYIDGENETWCDDCASEHKVSCENCNYDYCDDHITITEDEHYVCEDCAKKLTCEICGLIQSDLHWHTQNEHPETLYLDMPVDGDGVFESFEQFNWGFIAKPKVFVIVERRKTFHYAQAGGMLTVEAVVYDAPGTGLLITDKNWNSQGEQIEVGLYSITHNNTGRTLGRYAQLKDAIAVLRNLAEALDWNTIFTQKQVFALPAEIKHRITAAKII